LAPERIELETSRRSTIPDPKPIPLGQPKWVVSYFKIRMKRYILFIKKIKK